jgi:hypothetical protein
MLRVLGFVALCMGLYVACSRDLDEHPPPLPACTDPACVPVGGAQAPVAGGAMAGAGGMGGNGGSGDLGTLQGEVKVVVSADLDSVRDLADPISVRARGPTGVTVSTNTESDGTFVLEGVDQDPGLWVGTGFFDGSTTGQYVDTLQLVNAARDTDVNLVVLDRSTLEDLVRISFLNTPTEFDPQRGSAIVSFVDTNLDPISGLTVAEPNSTDVSFAYDDGNSYSDVLDQTGPRGTVVFLNVPASSFPGGLLNMVVLVEGQEYASNVRVVRGGVTLATAQLTLNP